jgi:Phytanoyl-CoA dioxygenase (PhyH)
MMMAHSDLWIKVYQYKDAKNMRILDEGEMNQVIRELEIYGYSQIKGYLSTDEAASLKDLVNHIYSQTQQTKYNGVPDRDCNDRIVYNLVNKDVRFLRLLTAPSLKSIFMAKLNDPYYRFLPPHVPNYYLGYYNARSSGAALDLHIDSHVPNLGKHTWSMQAAFMLDPHHIDNGCTTVVPGSHMQGTFTDRGLQKVTSVISEPGDLVLWDSRLWHGTNPNTANTSRWALIATMIMWWVKPAMDLTRSCSEELFQQLTPEEKALLGFCAIPPKDEFSRINTKIGYESLLNSPKSFYL